MGIFRMACKTSGRLVPHIKKKKVDQGFQEIATVITMICPTAIPHDEVTKQLNAGTIKQLSVPGKNERRKKPIIQRRQSIKHDHPKKGSLWRKK